MCILALSSLHVRIKVYAKEMVSITNAHVFLVIPAGTAKLHHVALLHVKMAVFVRQQKQVTFVNVPRHSKVTIAKKTRIPA